MKQETDGAGGAGAGSAPAAPADEREVSMRGPEAGVALLLMAVAVLVIVDSLRVGTGWGDDGPRSGYFPFYIGLALFGASAWTLLQTWRGMRRQPGRGEAFATRGQLASVWQIAWPMGVYVAVMSQLGLYVASVLLIGWFMRHHGRYRWWLVALVSVGVPLLAFLVFERWFLVPLPKGPLEAALGF